MFNECKSVCPKCSTVCISSFKCGKGEHWHFVLLHYQADEKHEWITKEEHKQQMKFNEEDELHNRYLMLKEIEINARIAVGEFEKNCRHVIVRTSTGMGVHCKICWRTFGWYCPKNPDKIYCEYDHKINSYGCKHCGVGSERK